MISNIYSGFLRDLSVVLNCKIGDNAMSRSKLEEYLSILEVLISQPLDLRKISHKVSIECKMLEKRLDFLLAHRLIEEKSFEKGKDVYTITNIGLAVFKTLHAKEYSERIYQNILRMHMHEQQIHVYP
jgi:predicted transcriptional regulator